MALMVGAMTIHNIQPGPQVMTSNPELFWGLIASMWIGNLMLIILNLPLIGIWIKLLTVPYRWLFPAIVLFCAIGVYSTNNNTFDVWMVAIFGVIGYLFIKLGAEPAPLLLGFILGPMMEENLRRALLLSRGDWSVFVTAAVRCRLGVLLRSSRLTRRLRAERRHCSISSSRALQSACSRPSTRYRHRCRCQARRPIRSAWWCRSRPAVRDIFARTSQKLGEKLGVAVVVENRPVDYARKNPGRLNYASSGNGTIVQLTAELFKSQAGLFLVHIPYKGTALAIPDLVSGKVDVLFDSLPTGLPHVRDGRLRALAVTSAQRTPMAPDLPAVAELLPGFESNTWFGLYGPKGLPADVTARVNTAVNQALADADVKERLARLGIEGVGGTPAQFAQMAALDAANPTSARACRCLRATSCPRRTRWRRRPGCACCYNGGNAVDAAVAAAAAMTICEPVSNGLGSDAFCILWDGKSCTA
jgi:hypothetical protein